MLTPLFNKIPFRFNFSLQWKIRYRRALAISLLLHILSGLVIAKILKLVFDAENSIHPSAIEFVFLPPEEIEFTANGFVRPSDESRNRAEMLKNTGSMQRLGENRGLLDARSTESQASDIPPTPLVPMDNMHEESIASPTPNDLAIATKPADLRSAFDYAPKPMTHTIAADIFDENYRLQPATLSITSTEKEKLSEKLERILHDFPLDLQQDTTIRWEWQESEYIFDFKNIPAEKPTQFDEVVVKIKKEHMGLSTATETHMRRMAFSHYAKFVDFWNPRIVLHDDEFDGRFHSNSAFKITNFGRRPQFRGKVTTSAHSVQTSGAFSLSFIPQRDSIFVAGLETGIDEIKLPRGFDAFDEKIDDSLTYRFSEETWLRFQRSGIISWRSKSEAQEHIIRLADATVVLLGLPNAKLHLQGVLAGKVMVSSKADILIDGSLVYKTDPRVYGSAEDYLVLCRRKI
ncbi:MAG: hypothetical protein H6696_16725 [Deferribacteres bacterium]|nr:hypothetical protein [candidate division KSB1 bacterium]MCB9503579.1 hypothetical protein [Deferribacteres bacterium]